ncbi:B3 DNA-binding domain protein [Medicago truncatula]|uniref:B3 DNA-binding domain protein n=1 Tax=Medicago truncatula TaxID=3880 RepID=A0A072VN61_MEDTR|nr:B3 DNA-binding domain protein [Medicago truncatula]
MAKGCSTTSNNYEAAREQRLVENKKRFEFGTDLPQLRRRARSSSSWGSYAYAARPLDEIKVATAQERKRAWDAAEALQINLQSSNPIFIKSMLRSHVYSCFWLGLPSRFCVEHLPKTDYTMVLEDEKGLEYDAVYLARKTGLSGGWRGFALEHKLDDGDAVVFELVEAARFKVYIVRAFENIDEEEEKEESDALVEDGNMCTSKTIKKSETVKPKEATKKTRMQKVSKVPTHEPKSETVKSEETSRTTRSSHKKQKISDVSTAIEPKEDAHLETVKPEAATKLPNKKRKAKEGDVSKKILLEDNAKAMKTDSERKEEPVEDVDVELKKVKLDDKASKPAAEKPRKIRAPKFFRKRG